MHSCPTCGKELLAGRCAACGEEYVTPAEAARRLGVSRQRVQYFLDSGRLPSVLIPSRRLVRVSDLVRARRRPLGKVAS